ncbi:MAG: NADH-quinone oxidoreductase subunit NuoK [Bdellovibrionota bacterium]
MTLHAWLTLSIFLFSTGIFGFLTRRTAVGLLISVELMLNAGAMNCVAFNRFLNPGKVDGEVMVLFVLAVTAAEILVGMAILVMLFRRRVNVEVPRLNALRH